MLVCRQSMHLVLRKFDTTILSAPNLYEKSCNLKEDVRDALDQLRLVRDLAALVDGSLLRPGDF